MDDIKVEDRASQMANLMSRLIGNSSRLTQELNRRMKQELSISMAKFDVLVAIGRAEGGEITMSNLSRELLVSNANMTGMTSRLQSDGLVRKGSLPTDRRIYSVVLTEKGQDILDRASEKHSIWIRELMSCVDSDELSFMNGFLDKMDRHAESFSQ